MQSVLLSMAVRLRGYRLLADPSILRGLSAIGRGSTMVGVMIFLQISGAALHFSDIESKLFLVANWSYCYSRTKAGPYWSKSGAVTLNRNLKFYRSRPSDQSVAFEPNLTVLAEFSHT